MNDWKDILAGLGNLAEDAAEQPTQTADDTPRPTKLPTLTLYYERKGRGGSPATIVSGLDPDDADTLKELASTLKRKLATGGSARDGEILLMGDKREQLRALLPSLGYKVKG
jgi:translation initiation factor 1